MSTNLAAKDGVSGSLFGHRELLLTLWLGTHQGSTQANGVG